MHSPLVRTAPVTFMAHLGEGHLTQGFDVAVVTNGLHHVRRRHLPMRQWTIAELEQRLQLTVEASADAMGGRLVLAHAGERELVEVVVQHGAGQLRTAADTAEAADALMERLTAELQEQDRDEDPRVPVWFWTLTEHGPQPLRRRLHAPAWSEIATNYVRPVREALDRVMGAPPDSAAQGIALWRGAPGTGKTTALRALAREWRDHAEVHVIVDPEVFLGEKASYLVEVLFGQDVDEPWDDEASGAEFDMPMPVDAIPVAGFHAYPGPPSSPRRRPAAKLIVLEDAGELISADARVSAGQALSRLLNLTDGMLGQGSNVSVLVTTNEAIDRLHPAIARPGRGWAHIEFRPLPVAEANDWLERAGSDERVDTPSSLAELYGLLRGTQVVSLDDLSE